MSYIRVLAVGFIALLCVPLTVMRNRPHQYIMYIISFLNCAIFVTIISWPRHRNLISHMYPMRFCFDCNSKLIACLPLLMR